MIIFDNSFLDLNFEVSFELYVKAENIDDRRQKLGHT